MRLFFLLTFLSLPALACPKLAGNYKICKSQTGQMPATYDFNVIQRDSSGTEIFHVMSVDEAGERTVDTFKADGKLYEQEMLDPYTGMKLFYSSLTKCTKDTLEIANKIMNEKLTITMFKQDGKLIQKITGRNLGKNVIDTITCE